MKHTIFIALSILAITLSACGGKNCKQVCKTTGDKASGNYSEVCKQVCDDASIGG